MSSRHRAIGPALAALLALAGCEDEGGIRTYAAPKDQDPDPHAGHAHAQQDRAQPPAHRHTGEDMAWVLPEGWRAFPGGRPMRHATLGAPEGVYFAVSHFAGDVGGRFDNVNRWRGQLGLPPLASPEEAEAAVEAVEEAGVAMDLVDLVNEESGHRMLVALVPRPEQTWFIKAHGDAAALEAAKPGFVELLRSIEFTAGPAPGASGAAAPFAHEPPAEWRPLPPARMRVLGFAVPGPEGAGAEVTVTRFPGDVGGLLPNVNRWRSQVGLPPLADEAEVASQPVEADGRPGRLLEIAGSERILVALVPDAGRTWFFKLKGDPAVVAAEAPRFQAWLGTVRFGAAAAPSPPAGRPSPAATGLPGWTAPDGWQAAASPRAPRLAAFALPGGGEVTVTRFPGSVGDLRQNVDRWRRQVGLPPLGAAAPAAERIAVGGAEADYVAIDGPAEGIRVAQVRRGAHTWFFKAQGPAEALAAEAAAFRAWLESVDWEGAR